ncbi:inositol monophosphatase family protein [Hydrogenovibrio halophilus]|uniref:inositol monophosphatase family protein n=1 Tax=Hydrogenovibrio halophilus TaxID=373391 RepID=UPI000378FE87|nr:inositol monophosphatase [Hydrogenovibrio halophilus]
MTHPFAQTQPWQTLKDGVRQIARDEVLTRFKQVDFTRKEDGSLLTEADTAMQNACQDFLQQHWPQFQFLGEESTESEQVEALSAPKGCWILDPVDGTSNFASHLPVYSISLALVIQGDIVLGLVYDPDRDEMFAARKDLGAELNGRALNAVSPHAQLNRCISLVDFKRLPPEMAKTLVLNAPYASQRSIGSVALDWCWIAAGRAQVYVHGAQNIWDYAAGWLILNEAGGQSATLDNDSVMQPRVIKRSAVAATSPELFSQWQTWLNRIK